MSRSSRSLYNHVPSPHARPPASAASASTTSPTITASLNTPSWTSSSAPPRRPRTSISPALRHRPLHGREHRPHAPPAPHRLLHAALRDDSQPVHAIPYLAPRRNGGRAARLQRHGPRVPTAPSSTRRLRAASRTVPRTPSPSSSTTTRSASPTPSSTHRAAASPTTCRPRRRPRRPGRRLPGTLARPLLAPSSPSSRRAAPTCRSTLPTPRSPTSPPSRAPNTSSPPRRARRFYRSPIPGAAGRRPTPSNSRRRPARLRASDDLACVLTSLYEADRLLE